MRHDSQLFVELNFHVRLNVRRSFPNAKRSTRIYRRTRTGRRLFRNFPRERDGLCLSRNAYAHTYATFTFTYGCSFADCAIAFGGNAEITFSPRLATTWSGIIVGLSGDSVQSLAPLIRSMILFGQVRFPFSWLLFYRDSHATHRQCGGNETLPIIYANARWSWLISRKLRSWKASSSNWGNIKHKSTRDKWRKLIALLC